MKVVVTLIVVVLLIEFAASAAGVRRAATGASEQPTSRPRGWTGPRRSKGV